MRGNRTTAVAGLVAVLGGLVAAAPAAADDLEARLSEVLEGQVHDFVVVEHDVAELYERMRGGEAVVPIAAPGGKPVEVALPARPVQLRDANAQVGYLRFGRDVERVLLPEERNFHLGRGRDAEAVGALTVLDDDATMVSGMIVHPELGTSFVEPVNLLLGTEEYPNVSLVYNSEDTEDFTVDDLDDEPRTHKPRLFGDELSQAQAAAPLTYRQVKIVLDGDRTFYQQSPSTVWSRQEAILNSVRISYGLVEPLSYENPDTARWGIDLKIKGQEVWVSGGPSTTDKVQLTEELAHPNYFLIHPVTNKELHLFLVGYNVSGVLGRAAGIGHAGNSNFGGSAGRNHAYSEAMTGQTFKSHWVVAAHEIGHLVGGQHGDGAVSGCTTFSFIFWTTNICGTSLMAAGGAGGPDTRANYFTDANDANIDGVLKAVLP